MQIIISRAKREKNGGKEDKIVKVKTKETNAYVQIDNKRFNWKSEERRVLVTKVVEGNDKKET